MLASMRESEAQYMQSMQQHTCSVGCASGAGVAHHAYAHLGPLTPCLHVLSSAWHLPCILCVQWCLVSRLTLRNV